MINIDTTDIDIICEDILNNEKFLKMRYEIHHGITRYEHSIRVAKTTYNILNDFNSKNLVSATRAALLHDFYLNSDIDNNLNSKEIFKIHPNVALNNAKKYFNIDKLGEDIIVNHMFPATSNIPKYKESVIVSLIDKGVSLYEIVCYKLKYLLLKKLYD